MTEDDFARRRELDALTGTQEKNDTELLFDMPHALRDRGLRDEKFFCGMRDIARACKRHEQIKILNIHTIPLFWRHDVI